MEIVIDKETIDAMFANSLSLCPFLDNYHPYVGRSCVFKKALGWRVKGYRVECEEENCPLKQNKTITIKCGDTKGGDVGKHVCDDQCRTGRICHILKRQMRNKLLKYEAIITDVNDMAAKAIIEDRKLTGDGVKLAMCDIRKLTDISRKQAVIKENEDGKPLAKETGEMKVVDSTAKFPVLMISMEYWANAHSKEKADEIARRFNLIDELKAHLESSIATYDRIIKFFELKHSPVKVDGHYLTARDVCRDVLDKLITGLSPLVEVKQPEQEKHRPVYISNGFAYHDLAGPPIGIVSIHESGKPEQPDVVDGKVTRDFKRGDTISMSQQEYENIMRQDERKSDET